MDYERENHQIRNQDELGVLFTFLLNQNCARNGMIEKVLMKTIVSYAAESLYAFTKKMHNKWQLLSDEEKSVSYSFF